MAVMTNLNTQSERMNSQTELLVSSKQLFELIEPWAALAGHKQANPALPENKAYEIVSASHIKFCYDLDAASRQHDEIIAAIEAGDEDRAGQLAEAHWNLSRGQIELFVMPDGLDLPLGALPRTTTG